jgi:hypothetical protein
MEDDLNKLLAAMDSTISKTKSLKKASPLLHMQGEQDFNAKL